VHIFLCSVANVDTAGLQNRYCCNEVDDHGNVVGKELVVKDSRHIQSGGQLQYNFHSSFAATQSKASELAQKFNDAVQRSAVRIDNAPTITFLPCLCFKFDHDGVEDWVLVEEYMKGKYHKFTSNNGHVSGAMRHARTAVGDDEEVPLTDFLFAFSHWTYVFSEQNLLVCDLQGTYSAEGKRPSFVLTDPAICTKSKKSRKKAKYGNTDVGPRAIRKFFQTHRCGSVCRALGLPAHTA
jgi:hypothetical protein